MAGKAKFSPTGGRVGGKGLWDAGGHGCWSWLEKLRQVPWEALRPACRAKPFKEPV